MWPAVRAHRRAEDTGGSAAQRGMTRGLLWLLRPLDGAVCWRGGSREGSYREETGLCFAKVVV